MNLSYLFEQSTNITKHKLYNFDINMRRLVRSTCFSAVLVDNLTPITKQFYTSWPKIVYHTYPTIVQHFPQLNSRPPASNLYFAMIWISPCYSLLIIVSRTLVAQLLHLIFTLSLWTSLRTIQHENRPFDHNGKAITCLLPHNP